ncbi:hypothetical protein AMJ40_00455 [candidate division TA06 bacterium DG_26]|uniref:Uncharacterized protein n=1 Tax=candidate division TA06 bacterium DG_26 TaxID=1703771 RepID=A0A0S7WMB6_UNCT6|nr:MAG: hypothetical protein AMJ40_00455 [candidate division TA06 bacterium DG_26]
MTDASLIQHLMELTGSTSITQLFNRALSLFKSATVGELGPQFVQEAKKLTVEEFVKREYALSEIRIKEKIVLFLLIFYGAAIGATFLLFYLRGFGLISLSTTEMKWLGGAVIGELAGLFAIVVKSVFPK